MLIDYVSERLGLNVYYDEQAVAQRVTIKTPVPLREEALLGLLEGVLQAKGFVLVDAEQPGFKRIVPVNNLAAAAQPVTRPSTQPAASTVVAQVIELQSVDPQRLEQLIRPFLTQPGGSLFSLPEQRLLVVTDYASNVERIRHLIDAADRPRQEVASAFLDVEHLDAQQLAGQLGQLLSARSQAEGTEEAGTAIQITPEPRTNRLVVIGPRDRLGEVETLIEELDVPLERDTRYYRLEGMAPERLDRLARELLPPGTTQAYRSAIDAQANLLIVTASPEVHQQIDSLREQLDVAVAEEQNPVRFYRLENTTAVEVLRTIRAIEGQGESLLLEEALPEPREAGRRPDPSRLPLNALDEAGGQPALQNAPPANLGEPLPIPPSYQGEAAEDEEDDEADPPDGEGRAEALDDLRGVQGVNLGQATVTADPNTNTIIVVGAPPVQGVYEQLIQQLDRRRPQVLIETTIVALDTTGNFSLGVEVGGRGSIDDTDFIAFSSFGLSEVSQSGQLLLEPGVGFNGSLVAPDVADLVVRALKSSSRAKVVSAPRILVNDNATGVLASVNEAPFVSVNASDTVATTSFAGFASAGTTVTVTPHISEGDHLQLEYSLTLNSFTGEGSEAVPPPRQSNTISSDVTIPDGHTIIVGGLNRQSLSRTVQRLPILGELPLVEYLFSNRSNGESRTTLFVFIRPIILRDDRFRDLKFLSDRDLRQAELAPEFPSSEPLILR